MEIIHYVAPRQTGKTTKAVEIFNQNPDDTYFVTINEMCRKDIIRRFNISSDRVLLANANTLREKTMSYLIFDEYLLSLEHSRNDVLSFLAIAFNKLINNELAKIYLFSTPTRKYTQIQIEREFTSYLNNGNYNNIEVKVIEVNRNPTRYGFLQHDETRLEEVRNIITSEERFSCDFLGIFRENQTKINKTLFDTPKKFNPKNLTF